MLLGRLGHLLGNILCNLLLHFLLGVWVFSYLLLFLNLWFSCRGIFLLVFVVSVVKEVAHCE